MVVIVAKIVRVIRIIIRKDENLRISSGEYTDPGRNTA